jgi:L-amino acid N-acyltransferase YncA
MIRFAAETDAQAIVDIYNYYIANTIITFEEQPITANEMARRMREIAAASLPWLVSELDGKLVGYAYASRWKGRSAYRFAVECTVYLDQAFVGKGLGSELYRELIKELKARGIHAAMGGVALPNPASVALHESLGFTKVAEFQEVGFKFNRWINVGYWQLIL